MRKRFVCVVVSAFIICALLSSVYAEKVSAPSIHMISMNPGEAYAFQNTWEEDKEVQWVTQEGNISYGIYNSDGTTYRSAITHSTYGPDSFDSLNVPPGGRAVITLDESGEGPLTLGGDAQAFRIQQLTFPAFLKVSCHAGETYEFQNTWEEEKEVQWVTQEGNISYVIYNSDGTTYQSAITHSTYGPDSFHSLNVPPRGRAVITLDESGEGPLILGGDYEAFSGKRRNADQASREYQKTPGEGQDMDSATKTAPKGQSTTPVESKEPPKPKDGAKEVKETPAAPSMQVDEDVLLLFGQYDFVLKYLEDLTPGEISLYGVKNWKEVLYAILKGGFNVDLIAKGFMNNPEKVKSLMKTVIDRLTGTKEAIDYAAVNKVLDNIEVAKLLKVFVSEGISKEDLDELNHLVDAGELTQNMFTDYSKSVAMLESLRNVSDANVFINEIVDDLIRDYRTAFVTDFLERKAKNSALKITDWAIGTHYVAVDKVIQTVLSHVPKLEGVDKVIGISTLKTSSIQAFRQTAEKILSGNYTQKDLNDYILSFHVTKELVTEEYGAMLSKYSPESREAMYLRNQIEALKQMTVENYKPAVPFEQFR